MDIFGCMSCQNGAARASFFDTFARAGVNLTDAMLLSLEPQSGESLILIEWASRCAAGRGKPKPLWRKFPTKLSPCEPELLLYLSSSPYCTPLYNKAAMH